MSATGTVRIIGKIVGLPGGSEVLENIVLSFTNANGEIIKAVLASGANNFVPPATPAPKALIIIPDPSNSQTMILKGVTGDTGIKLSKTEPFLLGLDPTDLPSNICITSGGAQSGATTLIWL